MTLLTKHSACVSDYDWRMRDMCTIKLTIQCSIHVREEDMPERLVLIGAFLFIRCQIKYGLILTCKLFVLVIDDMLSFKRPLTIFLFPVLAFSSPSQTVVQFH